MMKFWVQSARGSRRKTLNPFCDANPSNRCSWFDECMKAVFRVDASLDIGTGHVMRCLALANQINEAGGEARFVSRELPGNLCSWVESKKFQVHRLPGPSSSTSSNKTKTHRDWLGVDWR